MKTDRPTPKRRPTVTAKSAGRTKAGTSRGIYAPRTRVGPYLVPSEKSGLMLSCESYEESLVALACEFDPRVLTFSTQTCVLDVVTGTTAPNQAALAAQLGPTQAAAAKKWFGDFELILAADQRRIFVEAKPSERVPHILEEKLRPRLQACKRIGVGFLLVTDEHFVAPLAGNLRLLTRYRRQPTEQSLVDAVNGALALQPQWSAEELARHCQASLAQIYGLLAHGWVDGQLTRQQVSADMQLRRADASVLHVLPLHEEDQLCHA